MKIAKASPEDTEAILNLMRVLNSADDEGFPCNPDGSIDDNENWFDPDSFEDLRKFYDRVMGCIADHPGAVTRCIGGFHLAMTNGVWDPNADAYEWHPDLVPAVNARKAREEGATV